MRETLLEIVQEAGRRMVSMSNPEVYEKEGHANFVSSADIAVQSFLIERLSQLLPGSAFFAEEKEDNRLEDGYTWIIDPIDGTTNFLCGYRHSAISVALLKDKAPLLAAVLNPYFKEMFWAEKGKGAYLDQKPIKTSSRPLDQALVGFGTSPYLVEKQERTFRIAQELMASSRDIRRSGSAALDLCYVAAGRTDAFFEMILSPWDYAAASLILTEAGGKIDTFDGNRFGYEKPIPIVAANAACFERVLALMR